MAKFNPFHVPCYLLEEERVAPYGSMSNEKKERPNSAISDDHYL